MNQKHADLRIFNLEYPLSAQLVGVDLQRQLTTGEFIFWVNKGVDLLALDLLGWTHRTA